jgi:hypothetical protein
MQLQDNVRCLLGGCRNPAAGGRHRLRCRRGGRILAPRGRTRRGAEHPACRRGFAHPICASSAMPTAVRLRRDVRRTVETEGATDEDRWRGGARHGCQPRAGPGDPSELVTFVDTARGPLTSASTTIRSSLGGERERQCSRARTANSPKRSDEKKIGLGRTAWKQSNFHRAADPGGSDP